MDVNGSKYHLLLGYDDWSGCLVQNEEDQGFTPLIQYWQQADSQKAHTLAPLEFIPGPQSGMVAFKKNAEAGLLQLSRDPMVFRIAGHGTAPLDINLRRGAGTDAYGNWYWIDEDESGLRFLVNGSFASQVYWRSTDQVGCTPAEAGLFIETNPQGPARLLLRGLAVTTHGYLVVGDVTEHGLLLFDLPGGGQPTLLRWPEDEPFEPWDLAPTPDGGLLVLDRVHTTYWALDASFRLWSDIQPDVDALFQPSEGDQPNRIHLQPRPHGYRIEAAPGYGSPSPVSIEAGDEGIVFLLSSDPSATGSSGASVLYVYQGQTQLAAFSLDHLVQVVDPNIGEGLPQVYPLIGHDLAYRSGMPAPEVVNGLRECSAAGYVLPPVPASDATAKRAPGILYIADYYGNQVFAFDVPDVRKIPEQRVEYLPMRRWGGKGLVSSRDKIYYDTGDRWVELQDFPDCHYRGRAVLITPPIGINQNGNPTIPGGPFDSLEPGCTWHRLMLDALIPPAGQVTVEARAADSPDLLEGAHWLSQPAPYLRSGGCEISYLNPWSDVEGSPPAGTGTWELLFQNVNGRFLQLKLTIVGSGRSSPALLALRAWYPRFSYLDHYLPAFYQEDPVSASFLERWLANFEGLYTNLEDKIEHVAEILDPRTISPDALDWLACWLGLVLDPLWPEDRRRFFIRNAHQFYRWRGTLAGMSMALRMYLDKTLAADLFQPERAALTADSPLGQARIIELFRTRDVGGVVYGIPTETQTGPRPIEGKDFEDNAHRFTVLIPHTLNEEQQVMVAQIVSLEKPAHTQCDVKMYMAMFRVGQARLGIDTRLASSSTFYPLILGCANLNESYLPASYPFDLTDRLISDRDTLGELPAL